MTKKFNLFKKEYAARSWFVVFNSLFFILLMVCMIVPIWKIFSDSLVNETVYGLKLWPSEFNLIGYKRIVTDPNLTIPYFNLYNSCNNFLRFVDFYFRCLCTYSEKYAWC